MKICVLGHTHSTVQYVHCTLYKPEEGRNVCFFTSAGRTQLLNASGGGASLGPPTGNLLQHVASGMYVLFHPTGLRYVCYWFLLFVHTVRMRTESYFRVWLL
jgi:hypothetical protein